jgi:DNA-binding SARP family transcriptional activator
MEFRILGPLQIWGAHGPLEVGGLRPRALLAVLLLHANEVVTADQLIDALWGMDAPGAANATLRLNVSRLRKALPPDMIVTRSPGYVLRIEPDDIDLHRFERLVNDARLLMDRGRTAEASERLREALDLWRGPPLADFAGEGFALGAVTRLEEMRLAAVELLIDIDLVLGRHGELVGQLRTLVAEHPLREHFRVSLMTALYRSGRQAEALDVYQDARRVLRDELGIEPGRPLQELEEAILRHDRALDLPAAARPSPSADRERSVLVALSDELWVAALLAVAEPLARRPPRALILARTVADPAALRSTSARLDTHRAQLETRGFVARAATFTSTAPGADLARLSSELDVDLLLTDAPDGLLADGFPNDHLAAILAETTCDVAFLVSMAAQREGPVLVPFGGSDHDWSAVELGAWLARASNRPLRLAGTAAAPEQGRRDASRQLSLASLAVPRVLGVPAEPVLTEPGPAGMVLASRDAGFIVVGLSTRWRGEGLGPARLRLARQTDSPTIFVRRGLRPGGLAPPGALTRFTWSIRG